MRELGLQGKRKGTVKQKTTDSKHSHAIAENKLERKFDAQKPNQKWVADLTYIPTLEGWLFLAIVIDLFSRKRPKPVRCCLWGQENHWLEHERVARAGRPHTGAVLPKTVQSRAS